ncbi:MAG: phosphoribosylaminoimidazolesuccinocarboxamide synthase [Candidatus Colwellbacteria bacterium]|nr:phosphoribosylaminoimidazolesuccinocarboxamide synthase [Candidatus Colwellbacteria bacterium]
MTKQSPARSEWPLVFGLELISRGKVRDTYRLAEKRLLVVATDGISIFDFVLNALVPMKGVILNAMNHFWLNYLAEFGFETHFIASGVDIDKYLPEELRDDKDLQSRAMVVEELDMAKWEFIFRICLTGSGLSAYKENGEVCGHKLPEGLQDGDELPYILDTPTTKAEEGHDEHASAELVRSAFPEATYRMINIVQIARAYAESKGIKLADTKFEGSKDKLGDEVLTPDSSRFWDMQEWSKSRESTDKRKAPASLDKELVRIWGKSQGINKLDPKDLGDVDKVHAMIVPEEIISQTTATYRYIFWRLTGRTIEQYLREIMLVDIPERAKKNVVIICGSATDLPVVKSVCDNSNTMHVISCHRNPEELAKFIKDISGFDIIIGVGGKALALPGIIDAWIHSLGKNIPVAGVALGEPESKALLAAQLSIEEIPGQPVIIDEMEGHAYTGPSGLKKLLERITYGELPPPKPRTEKSAQMYV